MSRQERCRGKKVWSRRGKDEDEILLWFVKEVCCATGFKVGGKELCVVGDGGQNYDLMMTETSTEYMEGKPMVK